MRRIAVIAACLLGASVLAACQSQGVSAPVPQTVIGTVTTPTTPTTTFPVVPAFHLKGNASAGKTIFTSNCGSCHTLAAAGTSGAVGPNLDQLKPDYQAATAQVTNGGAVMPAFKGQLSDQQIADVATYVVTATGGKP